MFKQSSAKVGLFVDGVGRDVTMLAPDGATHGSVECSDSDPAYEEDIFDVDDRLETMVLLCDMTFKTV